MLSRVHSQAGGGRSPAAAPRVERRVCASVWHACRDRARRRGGRGLTLREALHDGAHRLVSDEVSLSRVPAAIGVRE